MYSGDPNLNRSSSTEESCSCITAGLILRLVRMLSVTYYDNVLKAVGKEKRQTRSPSS